MNERRRIMLKMVLYTVGPIVMALGGIFTDREDWPSAVVLVSALLVGLGQASVNLLGYIDGSFERYKRLTGGSSGASRAE